MERIRARISGCDECNRIRHGLTLMVEEWQKEFDDMGRPTTERFATQDHTNQIVDLLNRCGSR